MMKNMFKGCYTALVTPMLENGQIDLEGLENLVEFQVSQGVSGILAVGTTGESPTLDQQEQRLVIEKVQEYSAGRVLTVAVLAATVHERPWKTRKTSTI